MGEKLRVAIAGASGIGKHHAKWYHAAGCDVVGFWGRSATSCAATAQSLKEIFPFDGMGFPDLAQMLTELAPDVVDVCLPNELHLDGAMAALESGCHVLCEKPMVWEAGARPEVLLERARSLVEAARSRGLQFGVCTQYAAALPDFLELYRPARGELREVASFCAELETLSRGRRRSATDVWLDMGPHPLSLLLAWLPAGSVVPGSLRPEFTGREAGVEFDFAAGENVCRCRVVVRDVDRDKPVRRFGVNGFVVDCSGRSDDDGVYRSVLSEGGKERVGEDYMARLIAQFVQAARDPAAPPLVSGGTGLRNLELQLQILQAGSQGHPA